jgi:hypothetical protein
MKVSHRVNEQFAAFRTEYRWRRPKRMQGRLLLHIVLSLPRENFYEEEGCCFARQVSKRMKQMCGTRRLGGGGIGVELHRPTSYYS